MAILVVRPGASSSASLAMDILASITASATFGHSK
jgi:hypothetical protein